MGETLHDFAQGQAQHYCVLHFRCSRREGPLSLTFRVLYVHALRYFAGQRFRKTMMV